jgi:hypothetical protein
MSKKKDLSGKFGNKKYLEWSKGIWVATGDQD